MKENFKGFFFKKNLERKKKLTHLNEGNFGQPLGSSWLE